MLSLTPKSQKVVAALAVLVTTVSLAYIVSYRKPSDRRQETVRQLHKVVGAIIAEETIKLVGQNGKLLLVAVDNKPVPVPPAEDQLLGFTEVLRKRGKFTLLPTVRIPFPEGRTFGISADIYHRLLQEHPDVDAIISFVGAPRLTKVEATALPVKRPKFLAACCLGPGSFGLKSAFENNLAQIAIAPPLAPSVASGKAKSGRQLFDEYFQVITAADAAQLED